MLAARLQRALQAISGLVAQDLLEIETAPVRPGNRASLVRRSIASPDPWDARDQVGSQ
ncbi:MAG TPA: hypothetical protein VIG06_18975 [Kofleriaceae bacterium]|jgi:hypothetical protein